MNLPSVIFPPLNVSTCETYAGRGFPHEMIMISDDFGSDE